MVDVQASLLIKELETHNDPERAIHVQNYMKTSNLEFLGIPLPTIRNIARKHAQMVVNEYFIDYLQALWSPPIFDVRRAGAEVLLQFQQRGMDAQQIFILVNKWIGEIDTWALTDPLAWVIGRVMIDNPQFRETLKEWGESKNYWCRRMAIIPYLELCMRGQYRKEYGSWIIKAVKPHIGDSNFFVAKAVGWVLRQLSVHEPETVRQFIQKYKRQMNPITFREGSKKL